MSTPSDSPATPDRAEDGVNPGTRTHTLDPEGAAIGAQWERSVGGRRGRYRIEGRLGAGAMGAVYAALDPELDRSVAIKQVHPSLAGRGRTDERFVREARAMARLEHEHVVSVFDFGFDNDEPFLVMERVQGQTLRQWLDTRPSHDERLRRLRQAGAGLAAVHRAGVVHRDFKPDNVLVTEQGTVKVTDFGLARGYALGVVGGEPPEESTEPWAGEAVTQGGAVVGTPPYMSVEQHLAQPLTPRSDQYSFCVVLFEAWTGSRPFQSRSLRALLDDKQVGICGADLRRLPPTLARVVRRGLSPDPADRFADMDALLRALQGRRRSRWWWAGGAALIPAMAWLVSGAAEPSACQLDPSEAQSVWGEPHRRSLHETFARSSAAHAPHSQHKVTEILDGYARAWADSYEAACALGEVQRDPAMDCIRRRRLAFERRRDALIDLEPEALPSAIGSAESLPDPRQCLEPRSVRRAAARLRPGVAPAFEAVEALRTSAAEALRAGQAERGQALLLDAVAKLETVEPRWLRAEPLSEIGDRLDEVGATEAAKKALLDALYAASSVNDSELAATTATRLVWVEGISMDNSERGHQWVRQAQTLMDRFDPRTSQRVALMINRAALHQHDGDYDAALEVSNAALEALADAAPTSDAGERNRLVVQRGVVAHNIGVVQHVVGRQHEALQAFRRGVEAVEAARGHEHPELVGGLEGMLYAAYELGDLDAAREAGARWVSIIEDNRGVGHASLGSALKGLAFVEYAAGDLQRSREHLERAVGVLEPNTPMRTSFEIDLAGLLRELGDLERANEIATRTWAYLEGVSGPAFAGPRASTLRERALIASQRGEHERAVGLIEHANTVAEGTFFGQENELILAESHVHVLHRAQRDDEVIRVAGRRLSRAREAVATSEARSLTLTLCASLLRRGRIEDRARAVELLDEVEGWIEAGAASASEVQWIARLRQQHASGE